MVRNFILEKWVIVVILLGISVEIANAQREPPNIIFILADDLGWSSLSFRMQQDQAHSLSDYHETPNLARLAGEGMRFSRGYAPASICSPSRRSILFGQTPTRLGSESFAENYNPRTTKHVTIPRALKAIDARYQTAHYGKWDMRAGFYPEDAGYDESDGDTGNRHGNIFTGTDDKWTTHFMHDDPKLAFSLAGRATNFMERQVRSGNPFYLQVSHYATHVDIQARPDTYAKYKEKKKGNIHDDPGFAAMLEDLDRSIGQILDEVERLGISDNTFIFFMADNGATEFIPPVRNRLDHPSTFKSPMRNFPLRGGKWTLYEGGIRVPFLVKGPGIASNSQCEVPVAGWDLFPTFCDLAGKPLSPLVRVDGGSFVALLKNGGRGEVKRPVPQMVFHRYNNGYPHSALIDGDHKILKFWKTGRVEVYDLKKDPGEVKDISEDEPMLTRTLAARLAEYLSDVRPELSEKYK